MCITRRTKDCDTHIKKQSPYRIHISNGRSLLLNLIPGGPFFALIRLALSDDLVLPEFHTTVNKSLQRRRNKLIFMKHQIKAAFKVCIDNRA